MINRILTVWSRIETVIIGLLLIGALVIFLGGAALRTFAPTIAIDWAGEISLYCIVWASVLSGSVLVYERRHITTEIFVSLLPGRVQRILGLAMLLLTLVFCAVIAWYGIKAVDFALFLDERSASTLRVPQAWALFLALPVGMGLIVLRLILMLIDGTRSLHGDMLTASQHRTGTAGTGDVE